MPMLQVHPVAHSGYSIAMDSINTWVAPLHDYPWAVTSLFVLVLALAAWLADWRSEEHTSELQSLMRISYAVFCLKKKKITNKKSERTYMTPSRHQRIRPH